MRKHGPINGNDPNPAWVKRYKRTQAASKAAKRARRANRR